jgi:hypothetical protein
VRREPCRVGARVCHFAEQRTVDFIEALWSPYVIRSVPVDRNRELATEQLDRNSSRLDTGNGFALFKVPKAPVPAGDVAVIEVAGFGCPLARTPVGPRPASFQIWTCGPKVIETAPPNSLNFVSN